MLWFLTYAIVFLYCYYKFEKLSLGIVYGFIVTVIYITTAYGNSQFLIPRYFARHKLKYTLLSIIFLVGIIAIRMWIEHIVLYKGMDYHWFFNYTSEHFSFSSVTIFFAFLFGALLRISLDHVELLKKEEERKSQHIAAELSLLKSQVQPHFLFNALNNIYYLAYSKSDKAPESIARLSDTMRYFVEEAPKEKVLLKSELEFIRDYIEVERIRIPNSLRIHWDNHGITHDDVFVPPMLFIPLVENVFKHGVDKTRDNEMWFAVSWADDRLTFCTRNVAHDFHQKNTSGTGLNNLRKRLTLLFNGQAQLITEIKDGFFISSLTIPST
jgi:hypothetical protein